MGAGCGRGGLGGGGQGGVDEGLGEEADVAAEEEGGAERAEQLMAVLALPRGMLSLGMHPQIYDLACGIPEACFQRVQPVRNDSDNLAG